MSRPYFTAKHIESMALLPDNLEIGRAYFVDDEQVIVIDHGRGPVIYGKSPGPQGIAGEPIPQLQDQINHLAEAELTTQRTIWDINERETQRYHETNKKIADTQKDIYKAIDRETEKVINAQILLEERLISMHLEQGQAISNLTDTVAANLEHSDAEIQRVADIINANLEHSDALTLERFNFVKELTDRNAESIASLIDTLRVQFAKYDSALNILARSISELYPEQFAPEDSQDDPLDNETISTDSGSWTIQQTILKDGTVVLNLTPQEQVIDTLKVGDSVDFDGGYWTVEEITTEDGVTSIILKP